MRIIRSTHTTWPMSSVTVRVLSAFVVIRRDKLPTKTSALWLGHVYRKAIS